MISIVRRLSPSECPNCKKSSLSLYDKYDKRINYSLLCKYNTYDQIKKKLEKTDLKYLRCDNCKSVFILDWTKKDIPYPATKDKYIQFEK